VVTFMDQADAYAIADGGVPGLYASHDGGRSWALVNDGAYLAEIDCLGFFDCWALTQGDTAASGDLLRSADGGRTWTHLNPVVA
jgi:photosystem II stability/assembly factor-like uncharacterized protein